MLLVEVLMMVLVLTLLEVILSQHVLHPVVAASRLGAPVHLLQPILLLLVRLKSKIQLTIDKVRPRLPLHYIYIILVYIYDMIYLTDF